MLRPNRFAMLALALAATLAIAACGGDDGSEDEDQITESIEAAAVSGEPAACTENQTQRFTEQTTGETGEAAVTACEEDAADSVAESIEVSNIEVDGDAATAEGEVTGSFFDGQTIDIALVKEGDQWKLDELRGFVDFDRAAYLANIEEEVSSDEETPQQAVDCVTGNLEGLDDQQLQDLFINPDQQAEEQVFGSCFQ